MIVFLDIEGVLTTPAAIVKSYESYCGSEFKTEKQLAVQLKQSRLPRLSLTSELYHPFDKECIDNLHTFQRHIIEKHGYVKWLITDEWRRKLPIEQFKDMLIYKGVYLTGSVFFINNNYEPRGDLIRKWLNKNNRKKLPYIIITTRIHDVADRKLDDSRIVMVSESFDTQSLDNSIKLL